MAVYTDPHRTGGERQRSIELEYGNGCTATGGQADNLQTIVTPCKMVMPPLRAWIEQGHRLICYRINAFCLISFMGITGWTRQAKIIGNCFAAQFAGQNVVHVVTLTGQPLRSLTVFTAMISACAHKFIQLARHFQGRRQ